MFGWPQNQAASESFTSCHWQPGAEELAEDDVAAETAVAFIYNDKPFAVIMATPLNIADFALGFSVSG
jgi:FdhD protein